MAISKEDGGNLRGFVVVWRNFIRGDTSKVSKYDTMWDRTGKLRVLSKKEYVDTAFYTSRRGARTRARALERFYPNRAARVCSAAVFLVLALLTACEPPSRHWTGTDAGVADADASLELDGSVPADSGVLDAGTPRDSSVDLDVRDAGPVDSGSLDGGVEAAMTACEGTWPLWSGAIATFGCAIPPDNVCTSLPTVPTADVEACESALRRASSCDDVDAAPCWYVRP